MLKSAMLMTKDSRTLTPLTLQDGSLISIKKIFQNWRAPESKGPLVLSSVLFYFSWFGIIYYASEDKPGLCFLVTLSTLTMHFLWVSREPRLELLLFPILASLGFLMDGLGTATDLLRFSPQSPVPPIWLFEVWLIFVMTFRYSLSFFLRKRAFGATLAFFCAPINYGVFGKTWSLAEYGAPKAFTMVAHGGLWALFFWYLGPTYRFLETALRARIYRNQSNQTSN